jgi:hypothetical protein
MNYGAAVFAAVILGALTYYFFPKYGARYWFTYFFLWDELRLGVPCILCRKKLHQRWLHMFNQNMKLRIREGRNRDLFRLAVLVVERLRYTLNSEVI